MARSVFFQTNARIVSLQLLRIVRNFMEIILGVCSTKKGGKLQGFDGYKLSMEKEKSYVLTKIQGQVMVQLNTKSCSLSVGVCFRSIVITMNGKIFDISLDPENSAVS